MAQRPRQLGRYELIKRIAVGGMGEIYLAKSHGAAGFEKTVIIKKILDHLAEEEEFVTKFLDEGRIVVNLTHGNIVPVFDMGEEDGEYFIAMEYVPGRDLRDVLKRLRKNGERLPIQLAVHIITEACKGLDYAHRKTGEDGEPLDIVHRDVSPSNILISREGAVKVIDFGIARAASRAAKTVSGRIQGKICYMSPEQAGGKSVDQRSDIFSAGVLLYEMLTGTRPFEGDSDMQSLELVRQCDYALPSQLNDDIPDELDAIVQRALARERDERYQTIDALHVDLLEWLYSGGRAVTSQQLADFVGQHFPEGYEREELRKARGASSAEHSGQKAMNLDEALNAELEKLAADDGPVGIDPLSTTATEVGDAGQTGTGTGEASAATHEDGAGASTPDSQPGISTDTDPPASALDTAEANRDNERPGGFKRWLSIAAVVGLMAGAALLYFYSAAEYGKLEIRTEPEGASVEVDGARRAGVKTPATIELEAGTHTVELIHDGYKSQKFTVDITRGDSQVLDDQTISLVELARRPEERHAWVVVSPEEATININGGERVEQGRARVSVVRGEPILVEADHSGCAMQRKVITFEEASSGINIELDCQQEEPDDAEPADGDASETPALADDSPSPIPYKRVRFETDPPGASLSVDGEQVETGDTKLFRLGSTFRVAASMNGYASIDREVRIGETFPGTYAITLEELPKGCLRFRAMEPGVARVEIDGDFKARTGGDQWTLPIGRHRVTVSNQEAGKPPETYEVDITPGDCASLVVWEKGASPSAEGTN